eukprot:CAMPEP_0176116918 /NCGR_PEP_ID=MMETSP0120_2-20121206/58734_1 /TAXON_ID=160619 /ORGANISM="Kryptoperidinium foliaceum, Strain CCMP 1326" /LENGTH=75 /DNA_ID=CAMNT_0017451201 /DNA_START=78 /DNA_END=302 /DNA_ORIENTATION=+
MAPAKYGLACSNHPGKCAISPVDSPASKSTASASTKNDVASAAPHNANKMDTSPNLKPDLQSQRIVGKLVAGADS